MNGDDDGDGGPEQMQSLVAVGHAIERAKNLAGAGKGGGNKGKSSKRLGSASGASGWQINHSEVG